MPAPYGGVRRSGQSEIFPIPFALSLSKGGHLRAMRVR
jgi:hypothetical protein